MQVGSGSFDVEMLVLPGAAFGGKHSAPMEISKVAVGKFIGPQTEQIVDRTKVGPKLTSDHLADKRLAISAVCRPWYRAIANSFSLGRRDPSPFVIVEAP